MNLIQHPSHDLWLVQGCKHILEIAAPIATAFFFLCTSSTSSTSLKHLVLVLNVRQSHLQYLAGVSCNLPNVLALAVLLIVCIRHSQAACRLSVAMLEAVVGFLAFTP